MKKTILLLCAAVLTGCTALPVQQKLAEIPAPANLTVRCPDIPYIEEPTTMGIALQYIIDLQKQYIVCATRSDSIGEVITK